MKNISVVEMGVISQGMCKTDLVSREQSHLTS